MEIERNQTPSISPTILPGDNFVTVLRPTGLKQSSPIVCRKYTKTNHIGLTRPEAARVAANAITTKAIPAKNSPIVNFPGLEGWRSPSFCQTAPMIGAKMITKIAGTDWNQLEGY